MQFIVATCWSYFICRNTLCEVSFNSQHSAAPFSQGTPFKSVHVDRCIAAGPSFCQPSFRRLGGDADAAIECGAYDEENHNGGKNAYRYQIAD